MTYRQWPTIHENTWLSKAPGGKKKKKNRRKKRKSLTPQAHRLMLPGGSKGPPIQRISAESSHWIGRLEKASQYGGGNSWGRAAGGVLKFSLTLTTMGYPLIKE